MSARKQAAASVKRPGVIRPALLVTVPEAADMLAIGETLFRQEVLSSVETVEINSVTRVVVESLRAWVESQRATLSDGEGPSAGGKSVSATMVSGLSDLSESGIQKRKQRQKELLAKYSRSSSRKDGGGNVVRLNESQSRKGRRNG